MVVRASTIKGMVVMILIMFVTSKKYVCYEHIMIVVFL